MIKIVVSKDDFSIDAEYRHLSSDLPSCGAVVTFTGLVREFSERTGVTGMRLEHYPGMTEKALGSICAQAAERWDVQRCTVIHRVGDLKTEEQIVFVGVASAHREDAFEACRFIMDYLKTEAPFWKKELTEDGEFWVEARDKDQKARECWGTPDSD